MKNTKLTIVTSERDSLLLSPVRLPILVLLAMYDEADFTFIKNELNMSDGNLGANLRKLEQEGYVMAEKKFIGRKPRSTFKISPKGLVQLKDFIQSMKNVGKAIK